MLMSSLGISDSPRPNDLRKQCRVELTIFNKNKLSAENKSKSFYYVIYIVKVYLNCPLREMYNKKKYFQRNSESKRNFVVTDESIARNRYKSNSLTAKNTTTPTSSGHLQRSNIIRRVLTVI